MKALKRPFASVISASILLLFCHSIEYRNSVRGQDAPQTKVDAANDIPPSVRAVVTKSDNRFALTDFVKRALIRRTQPPGIRAIAPGAVGAAPLAEAVKDLTPGDVEDAVISLAHELSGAVPPPNLDLEIQKQNALAQQIIDSPSVRGVAAASSLRVNSLTNETLSPNLPRFDWRDAGWVAQNSGIISRAKDQGTCGCCWAFATIGTFEGADALANLRLINASEQNLLDCAGAFMGASAAVPYNCPGGGWWVFDYVIQKGVATENAYPYQGAQQACRNISPTYRAKSWKYVLNQSDVPTTAAQISQIKDALCKFGPIGAAVYASGAIFGGYGPASPPISDFQSGNKVAEDDGSEVIVDHVVVIVGWNDAKHAWAIKNSWAGWGADGFGYIDYLANNIGFGAAHVVSVDISATAPVAAAARAAVRSVTTPASPRELPTIALPRLIPKPGPAVGATHSSEAPTPTELSPVSKNAIPAAPTPKSPPR
jgi:C1A family cysteine protease